MASVMFTSPSLLQSRAIGHGDGGPPWNSSFRSQTGSEMLTSPSLLASHRINLSPAAAATRDILQPLTTRGGEPRVCVIEIPPYPTTCVTGTSNSPTLSANTISIVFVSPITSGKLAVTLRRAIIQSPSPGKPKSSPANSTRLTAPWFSSVDGPLPHGAPVSCVRSLKPP